MDSGADRDPPPKAQPLPSISAEGPRISKPPVAQPLYVKQEILASPASPDLQVPDTSELHRGYEAMPPVGSVPPPHRLVPRELPIPDEAQVEAELARIETAEMSDLDGPGFEVEKEDYLQRGRKRALELDSSESAKRKVSLQ